MTANDQLHAQMAYIKLRDVIRELDQIEHRDCMMMNLQISLNRVEETLQHYIGPLRKENK